MPGTDCAVSNCKNSFRSIKEQGKTHIRFHVFPKDLKIREKWVKFCQKRGKWNPTNRRICSDHFEEDDFEHNLKNTLGIQKRRNLKRTAVPTIRSSISQKNGNSWRKTIKNKAEYNSNQGKCDSTEDEDDPETANSLNLLSTLSAENSNIEIEIQYNKSDCVPEKSSNVKTAASKDQNVSVVPTKTLEEWYIKLCQENKILKEQLEKSKRVSPDLTYLVDNREIGPSIVIDLRNVRDLCRGCLQKSTNLISIHEKITLQNAMATEMTISEALESLLSDPVQISDNLPNKICESCKNQIILINTFKYAFKKANSILQLYTSAVLEQQQAVEKQTLVNEKCTEDYFEQEYQQPEFVKCEIKCEKDVSDESETIAIPSEEQSTVEFECSPANLQNKIQLAIEKIDSPKPVKRSRPPKRERSETPDRKKNKHTCPICWTRLSLAEFIPHVKGHKMLKKYFRGPKRIRKVRYYAVPRNGEGLIGGEGKILHTCHICQKQLPAAEYILHVDHHLTSDHFTCNKCNRGFKNKKFLMSHMLVHADDFPFKCSTCGKGFVIRNNYKWHLLTHKDGELPHACPECDKKFSNPTHLHRHMTIHTENKTYSNKYRYKRCTYCYESVMKSESLKSHVCKNPGLYQCKYCEKLFKSPAARTFHVSSEHTAKNKPGYCKECNVNVIDVNSHRLLKHAKEKTKALCTVCGSHVWNIRIHMQKHKADTSEAAPFRCHVCFKHFAYANVLKKHLVIHSGIKPYICSFCAKAFNSQYNLEVHERIHVGNRCHVCPFCDKGFLEKSYLNKHLKTHKDMRFCEENFYNVYDSLSVVIENEDETDS